jgi:alkylation response protein AidB-like acyl-CoA dehydrogenase
LASRRWWSGATPGPFWRPLLEEVLATRPIGEPLHQGCSATNGGQERFLDGHVIVDQIEFGGAETAEEHLVRAGDACGFAVEFELDCFAEIVAGTLCQCLIVGLVRLPGGSVHNMDPTYPAEAEPFREKIQAFLAEKLPTNWAGIGSLSHEDQVTFTTEWRKTLYENNLLGLSWPTEFGGPGLTSMESVIVAEEFARVGVPMSGPNDPFGIQMVGNTIIHWGTEEQKKHFLPRILSGEDLWCQGYSEPGSGSDLANLGCKAELDGDEWIVNGQKIWTSAGHLADWIFVLTRTDADLPKHKGISFMLCPMDQPGVEVRPIKMISGESEFNEVFFTDARIPKENVIGEVNGGWAVAMTLLGFERGEAAATTPIQYRVELDRMTELAKITGANEDPNIRQRLAWCHQKVEMMRYLGMRTRTKFLAGQGPGPDAAINKLYWSEYHLKSSELAIDILGAQAMAPTGQAPASAFGADDPGVPADNVRSWVDTFFTARAGTIYAGTSQVQRNIIGEMVLGLPKEPKSDKGSWREAHS